MKLFFVLASIFVLYGLGEAQSLSSVREELTRSARKRRIAITYEVQMSRAIHLDPQSVPERYRGSIGAPSRALDIKTKCFVKVFGDKAILRCELPRWFEREGADTYVFMDYSNLVGVKVQSVGGRDPTADVVRWKRIEWYGFPTSNEGSIRIDGYAMSLFFGRLNPLQDREVPWHIASTDSDRIVFEAVHHNCRWRFELKRSGGELLPVRFLVNCPDRRMWRAEIKGWKKISDAWWFEEAIYERKLREDYQLIRLRTISIKRIESEPLIEIEKGVPVYDYRLQHFDCEASVFNDNRNALLYPWEGRLPSLEELKRLAYAQGNLLPPEAPRRRYSLVLFVPAVVLFLLAGYLYWKQRKK